jgi:hypothetical protein
MAPSKITFLQIGDVHYPEWKNDSTPLDVKVSTFSPTIVSNLTTRPLTSVLTGMRDVCRDEHIDAVLAMGDFTSTGKVQFIRDAVIVLEGIINDSFADRRVPIFGVPGNHDVSREDAIEFGDVGKFAPLQDAFKHVGWRPPPVQTYVRYNIPGKHSKLPLVLMNSSIGSWSKALFPAGLRDTLFGSNEDADPIILSDSKPFGDGLPAASPKNILTQVYEQIDTPYFRAVDLDEIAQDIGRNQETTVVVSHHNILPQYLPRISYFGEVLNAGYARRVFLNAKANILYLHGHIHDDPVEIVRLASDRGPQIISIAAPEVWKGFNKITLFYENHRPFLIRLTRYRVDGAGRLALADSPHLFPLMSSPAELLKRDVYRFWNYLTKELPRQDGEVFNWEELVEHGGKVGIPDADLEPIVMALFCSGLVQIHNFGDSVATWRVEIKS